jgi:hypothetical protein
MHKIDKGDFNACSKAINNCIKLGYLPIDFTAKDQDPTRSFRGIHKVSGPSVLLKEVSKGINEVLDILPHHITDYWKGEKYYVMMCVEKIDIYNLYDPICREYNVPIVNSGGWYTLKPRNTIAELSKKAEEKGLKPVLILFYDHDITGLKIPKTFRKGLRDMMGQTKWNPSNLIIDRFGLNYDDIDKHGLTWIPNLKSSSGKDPDYRREDVREYIHQFGERKCEANALLKNEETLKIGQELCRNAIEKYYGEDSLDRFTEKRKRSKKNLKGIYDNPIWEEVQGSLEELIEEYDSAEEEDETPEAEQEHVVTIYEQVGEDRYNWGRCPSCGSSFDYDMNYIDKLVRCRNCHGPMRLKKQKTQKNN